MKFSNTEIWSLNSDALNGVAAAQFREKLKTIIITFSVIITFTYYVLWCCVIAESKLSESQLHSRLLSLCRLEHIKCLLKYHDLRSLF